MYKQLQKYKYHKTVSATRVREVKPLDDGGAILMPYDSAYQPIKVDKSYVGKHQPYAGGYYVVYESSYTSFSPQEEFEEGYSLIKD